MADLVGKDVVVVGTSRDDLNGTVGVATEYLEAKGRVAVKFENGKSIALKPENLEVKEEEKEALVDGNNQPLEIHDFSQEVGFRARPEHLFNALTDKTMLSGYTQTKCESDPKVGGKFSFFDGNITGVYTTLDKDKTIGMKWRNKDWHKGHYSDVTISLESPSPDVCKVTLEQTGIPEADKFGNSNQKDVVMKGWENFFWERIQKMVGYHKVDKVDW